MIRWYARTAPFAALSGTHANSALWSATLIRNEWGRAWGQPGPRPLCTATAGRPAARPGCPAVSPPARPPVWRPAWRWSTARASCSGRCCAGRGADASRCCHAAELDGTAAAATGAQRQRQRQRICRAPPAHAITGPVMLYRRTRAPRRRRHTLHGNARARRHGRRQHPPSPQNRRPDPIFCGRVAQSTAGPGYPLHRHGHQARIPWRPTPSRLQMAGRPIPRMLM